MRLWSKLISNENYGDGGLFFISLTGGRSPRISISQPHLWWNTSHNIYLKTIYTVLCFLPETSVLTQKERENQPLNKRSVADPCTLHTALPCTCTRGPQQTSDNEVRGLHEGGGLPVLAQGTKTTHRRSSSRGIKFTRKSTPAPERPILWTADLWPCLFSK